MAVRAEACCEGKVNHPDEGAPRRRATSLSPLAMTPPPRPTRGDSNFWCPATAHLAGKCSPPSNTLFVKYTVAVCGS